MTPRSLCLCHSTMLTAPLCPQQAQTHPVLPHQAHHGLPPLGSLYRINVRFLDPEGLVQHIAITTTWACAAEPEGCPMVRLMLRGMEQAGCKVLEAVHYADVTIDL